MATVRERLSAFMERQNITRHQLASALCINVGTMDGWRYSGRTPPAVMLAVLDWLENDPRLRAKLRLNRKKERPRGRPFPKGHQFRFGDPRRESALAEKRKSVA